MQGLQVLAPMQSAPSIGNRDQHSLIRIIPHPATCAAAVQHDVGAAPQRRPLARAPGGATAAGPLQHQELGQGQAQPARRGMHQNALARFDTGGVPQALHGGEEDGGQGGRLGEGHAGGDRGQCVVAGHDVGGQAPCGLAKHDVAGPADERGGLCWGLALLVTTLSSCEVTIRPEEPWHTSITTIRCHLREQAGEATEVTLPAQSLPGSPGSPGYMPSTFSTSLKLRPTARTLRVTESPGRGARVPGRAASEPRLPRWVGAMRRGPSGTRLGVEEV